MEDNLIWSDSTKVYWEPKKGKFILDDQAKKVLSEKNLISAQNLFKEIEHENAKELTFVKKSLLFRQLAVYSSLIIVVIIFVLTIVGASLEAWECFLVLAGVYFFRNLVAFLANYFYYRPGFHNTCMVLLINAQTTIDKYNQIEFSSDKIVGIFFIQECKDKIIKAKEENSELIKIKNPFTACIGVEFKKKR